MGKGSGEGFSQGFGQGLGFGVGHGGGVGSIPNNCGGLGCGSGQSDGQCYGWGAGEGDGKHWKDDKHSKYVALAAKNMKWFELRRKRELNSHNTNNQSRKTQMNNTVILNGIEYVPKTQSETRDGHNYAVLKYAVVRSRDQGVMAGYVVSIEGRMVTLRHARQLWRWDSTFVLPDMAENGVRNAENCKFSTPMSEDAVMLEACGVMYCTAKAGESIRAVPDTVNAA